MKKKRVQLSIDTTPVRSALATRVFVILTAAAVLIAVMYALSWGRLVHLYPPWAAYCLMGSALARLVAVVGIWRWSKAAIVLYLLLSVGTTAIWFEVGRPEQSVFGIVSALLLLFVVLPQWSKLYWSLWGEDGQREAKKLDEATRSRAVIQLTLVLTALTYIFAHWALWQWFQDQPSDAATCRAQCARANRSWRMTPVVPEQRLGGKRNVYPSFCECY